MEKNNKTIIFNLPGETVLADVFDEILNNNGLEETTDDFLKSIENNQEPRVLLLIDVAKTIFQKKIPKDKTVELLQKHLEISKEKAEKLVIDIEQKIIPYVKEISNKEGEEDLKEKLSAQDFILEKIRENAPSKIVNQEDGLLKEKVKMVEIKNVEKNAENIKKTLTRGNIVPKMPVTQNFGEELNRDIKDKKKDVYREPIE